MKMARVSLRTLRRKAIATTILGILLFLEEFLVAEGQNGAQTVDSGGQSSLAQAFQPRRDDTHVGNVVKQAVADEFSSEINTNRTKAYLSCESGEMLVKINFSEPFRGVGYADYDRSSPCRFYGDGSKYYELHIPLKGCGTKQEAPRLFINNIIVRFHRSLELEEDEIKTIICRYPPPFAPLPTNVVAPAIAPLPVAPALIPAKLSEIELLLIICALLFLTLLLLGIGIAYYCLKKRNIKVVKKKAFSSAPGSEITKLSGSTLGAPALSIFEPIRIPRAQAALSMYGSEAALLTPSRSVSQQETIPSDYPSESPSSLSSDVDEMVVDNRRALVVNDIATMREDRYRFENLAFIPDEASIRSGYPVDQERAESVSSVPIFTVPKPPTKIEMPKPRLAKEQTLTTIHEREDSLMSDKWATSYAHQTMIERELLPPVESQTTRVRRKKVPPPPPSVSSYAPSLYGSIPDNNGRAVSDVIEITAETTKSVPPPPPPPVPPSESSYAPSLYGSIPDNDICSRSEVMQITPVHQKVHQPTVKMATLTDYYIDTQNTTDIREDVTTYKQHLESAPPVPTEIPEEITEVTETTIIPHKPKITVKNIDDVYVTTLHEIDASEHITKRTRDTIEEHRLIQEPPSSPPPPPPPPTTFDVTIRTYPRPPNKPVSSASSTTTEREVRSPISPEPERNVTNITSTTNIDHTTIDHRYQRNWDDTYSEVSERFSDISEPLPPNLVISQPRTGSPPPPPQPESPLPEAVSPTPLPERTRTPDTDIISGIHPIEPESNTGTVPSLPVLDEKPTLPTTWSVLVRVLKPPPNTEGVEELTPHVREKWRSVITTDTVFRSLIQECTTTEEYVRVTRIDRYYRLFTPTTWEVIIRVLSAPLEPSERDNVSYHHPGRNLPNRFRRKSDTSEPSRPRKNSLPPVYEGDSSNPPSVERTEPQTYYTPGSPRSRRTSKAGSIWEYDVRSMTEEDVDFTRADRESLWSVDTGYTYQTGKSYAERSTSEFLEDVPTVNRRYGQPPRDSGVPLSSSAPNPSYRIPMGSDPEDDDDQIELPIYPVTTISNRSGNMYTTDSRAYTQVSQNIQSSYSAVQSSSSNIRQERDHQERRRQRNPRSIGPPPSSVGEREEIHSVTETDIYDWNR